MCIDTRRVLVPGRKRSGSSLLSTAGQRVVGLGAWRDAAESLGSSGTGLNRIRLAQASSGGGRQLRRQRGSREPLRADGRAAGADAHTHGPRSKGSVGREASVSSGYQK